MLNVIRVVVTMGMLFAMALVARSETTPVVVDVEVKHGPTLPPDPWVPI